MGRLHENSRLVVVAKERHNRSLGRGDSIVVQRLTHERAISLALKHALFWPWDHPVDPTLSRSFCRVDSPTRVFRCPSRDQTRYSQNRGCQMFSFSNGLRLAGVSLVSAIAFGTAYASDSATEVGALHAVDQAWVTAYNGGDVYGVSSAVRGT